MGKRSGITKGGRVMNPADRERKQQRAKELKRNKKQRTAVRQAIVKSRDPEEIIEQMSRLDDQEFDTQRQLSLNVIQEKRHKLRGTFIQIINLTRQEKEDKKTKDLERMMYEYEIERRKKEESYRAMMFSENSNFDEIPLPSGLSAPDAASTPFLNNIGGFDIGPQIPVQLQAALKAGILKKSTVVPVRKKHKYPPGPPPGLPLSLFESEDDDENEQDEQNTREDYRRRNKRVRFGERISQFEDDEKIPERREQDEEEIDEDYAPVEIPESMLATDKQSQQQQSQSVLLRPIPSLSAPQVGFGPIQPSIVLPSQHPHYPAYPIQPGYIMRVGPSGAGPYPSGSEPTFSASMMHTRGGIVNGNNYSSSAAPPDPHPSAIISAEPQVVKPNVNIVPRNQNTVTGESFSAAPQMRDIKREATRFVPTAVKIHRPVVPTQTSIGPRLPTASGLGAGATRLMPRTATTSSVVRPISGKTKTRTMGVVAHQKPAKSVDEACDEFLNELQGLL